MRLLRTNCTVMFLLMLVDFPSDHSFAWAAMPETVARSIALYHSDPQHLWNRLHEALWDRVGPDGRVYGHDRVDPLLWSGTRHFLEEPSRNKALQVLNEFLEKHGETLIDDPLKRAILQRDLWAIFDWLANRRLDNTLSPQVPIDEAEKGKFGQSLALAIGRLALDPRSIERLPDTYSIAVASGHFRANNDPARSPPSSLPPDLFDPDGAWVCVGRNGSDVIAPAHARGFSRSIFQVFLKLPDGRKATSDYLATLSEFKEPFLLRPAADDGRSLRTPNPELPQYPTGTQLAIVRSAMIIDSGLQLRATRIVESVQLRGVTNHEFALNRALLFGGVSGGLRAVAVDERDLSTNFNATPNDVFERNSTSNAFDRGFQVVLQSCAACHRSSNVHSFNTFVGGFSPPELNPSLFDARATARGEGAAIRLKQTRYDWGLLEGLLSGSLKTKP